MRLKVDPEPAKVRSPPGVALRSDLGFRDRFCDGFLVKISLSAAFPRVDQRFPKVTKGFPNLGKTFFYLGKTFLKVGKLLLTLGKVFLRLGKHFLTLKRSGQPWEKFF